MWNQVDFALSVEGSSQPVVVLRLRGRTKLGATLLEVLDRYAEDLADSGGRLYLSGVAPDVAAELRRTGKLDLDGVVHVAPSDEVIGASTSAAVQDARAWLGRNAKRSSV